MADLAALTAAIERGDRETATDITRQAIADRMDPETVLAAMTGAMEIVGGRFQAGELYVPEMLISARAMKESVAILEPLLVEGGVKPEFTAVIGTVKGDLHDIGKNLVGMMLRGAGFEVVDLGVDVRPEAIADEVEAGGAAFVGLSTLLTTTQPAMADAVELLRGRFPPERLRILVGGAPVTEAFAADIGADGTAGNASAAVRLARAMAAV